MQDQPPRQRGGSGQHPAAASFEEKLEQEERLLDGLLTQMARNILPADTWEKLHAAAQRDDRQSELAFAFESVSQSKRLKTLPPGTSAEFLFQAARFFGDVFGDELGAVTYLERALVATPGHAGAFAMLERLLEKAGQHKKLSAAYAAAATHKPRPEQADMLRKAALMLEKGDGADDKVIELWQQVHRLEPNNEEARARLETLLVMANKLREVARLNEQALASDPPPDEKTRKKLLARVIELYADKLHEPERAMPHVELLLSLEPRNEDARKVAQKLLVIKGLAGRAAAALARAHSEYGTPQDIARFLLIELESTRGPKRAAVLAKLGVLRQTRMGDEKGALEAFEQTLAIDPADDDSRARYVAIAGKMQKWVDAAKTLSRVLATVKDAVAKARATAQLGEMLLRSGDAKRAKTTLATVLATAEAPPDAVNAAARLLREIHEKDGDKKALADVLERIGTAEPNAEARRETDEQLAALATELGDLPRAILAYERLLSTSARPRALEALTPLYEQSGDPDKHARLLEERAKDTEDSARARELMMQAVDVRVRSNKDPAAAIATCRAIIDRFVPARDVLAQLLPLLEAQRKWPELAEALAQEAQLVAAPESAQVLARLGTVRMQRLRDLDGAIEAFRDALAIDATEKTARSTLEKLAALGDHRLAAARVLEPVYRREGAAGPLSKMIELRGQLSTDVDERLTALGEACDLAAGETSRATDLAGRALGEAVAAGRPISPWLERLDRFAGPGTDPKRRAAILGKAIGDREVTSDEMSVLAKRAAEAHAAAGEVATAIALYRRALAHDPHSPELLSHIDDLLRDRGSPAERVALYRTALERAAGDPGRRRELLHRIGAIERHDLGDARAAIETYRAALADDPDDADAHAALAEMYAQSSAWGDLGALLEAKLARSTGDAARVLRAHLAEVAAVRGDTEGARAQATALLEDPQLGPDELSAVERAADTLGDPDLCRAAYQRRADMAQDPREQIAWLDRIGELDEERRGDLEAAAAAWKRAGVLAEAAGDDEQARRLMWRARKVAPEDREVAERLVALCERGEQWSELPRLYAALVEHTTDDAERVSLMLRAATVLSDRVGDARAAVRHAARAFEEAPARADVLATFERLAVAAGEIDSFLEATGNALDRLSHAGGADAEARVGLAIARARALAADPGHADEAARAYRAILAESRVTEAQHASVLAAFDALASSDPESPARRADRRWLLEWRAEHAPEDDRVARLLEWAREEESTFSDPVHALGLHRRVLALDAEHDESLSAVARLALATGDTEAALTALAARRDRAEGPAKIAVEMEIAQVLLSRTTRWADAMASLRNVLAESPGDPTARALATQLLAHRATRADTITMLEQACDATEDPEARAQMLGRLLDAPADADDASARQRWFERLADLQREQSGPEKALATVVRAARELPDVPALWDRAEELARTLSRADEVAALYEEVLGRALNREQALAIGERAVPFYEEWFEDSGRVVRILERVLEIDPTADWAFDRLKLLLDSAERWDDLFALYDRALEAADKRKRIALLEDAAQTAKDFADRPDRAIDYLEQLHELKPGDGKLASSLERLYERQGRHQNLVTLLTARLPSLKREEASRTRARVAALWLDELGDAGAALEAVEPLLGASDGGGSANGANEDVWGLLERILAAAPPTPEPRRTVPPPSGSEPPPPRSKRSRKSEPPSTARGSVRQRSAALLREHYAGSGRDADHARMLLIELEAVKSTKERVRRHVHVAELLEKLGDLPGALDQVAHSVALDPSNEGHREKLAALAERTGRLDKLGDALASAADAADEQALRVALMMQAATVRADRAGDATGAIVLLAQILTLRRVPEVDVLAAARKLDPLLEAAGRPEERLDVLDRIAEVDDDPTARRDTLGRAARLATQLGQNARAVAFWERRLDADERDPEALDGLVDLLEPEGKHARLAEVLALRARVAPSDERRRADRARVARLLGEQLGKPKDAIAAWREIETEFGEADDAALALAGLLRATERWKDLGQLLERGSQRTQEASTRAELLRQLGDLEREHLDAPADAVRTYERALVSDPRNAGARAGLLALAGVEAHRAAAVDALFAALRSCDDWQAILELTAHRLLAAPSNEAKLAVLLEAAEIAERRAGDAGLAFEAMRRAFSIAPGDERVQGEAARLAQASGGWREIVETYREAIDGAAAGDAALVTKLRRAAGDVLERQLDDPRAALAAYLRVVADAADVGAAISAIRVAGRLGQWDVATRVVVDVSRAIGAAPAEALEALDVATSAADAWDETARALGEAVATGGLRGPAARDVEARLGEWHRDRRNDPDAAEQALLRALAHDDANAPLLAALAQVQRRRKGRPLVDSLQRLSRATGGDMALLREAAEVARDGVGDHALARGILEELLGIARSRWMGDDETGPVTAGNPLDPIHLAAWAIEGLASLHEADNDDQAVVDVLALGDALPFEPIVRRGMRRRAARIALDRLGDHARGVALYLALFEDDPHDTEAIERLSATYAAQGRTRELLQLRERQVVASGDVHERLALRLEAARLFVELGDPSRAAETLGANLRDEPRHEASVEALAAVLDADVRRRDLRDLLATQAQLAEDAGDTARAASLWARAAVVAEERLRDLDTAAVLHARVVALEPRAASFDAIARLATIRGDQAAAAAALGRLVEVVDDAGRVDAVLRLAEALVASGNGAGAAERLEHALASWPEAELVRDRLAVLYEAEGLWAKLAQLVTDSAAHAPDKPTRLARLRQAARLFVDKCGEPERAVPLLEQASDLATDDQALRLALADALARAGRFEDARAILKAMIDAFGGRRPKERAPVQYQIARLELAMGNRARALVELDTATRVDPQNPEILRTLAELARDDGQFERAEKSYRALLVVLRRRDEANETPSIARSEVLLELSAMAARQDEHERAREIMESALEAGTKNDFEQDRLEAALRARGDYDTLVRVLESRLARSGDTPAAAKSLGELADVLSEKLGRGEAAFPVRLRAVAADPRSPATHEAALTAARAVGAVDRYVDGASALVDRAIEAGEVSLACSLLVRLGGVAEQDLHDDRRAAALLERAVDLGMRTPDLLRALDRAYERAGEPDKQARVLAMRVEVEGLDGGPRAASDAIYRLASVRLASSATVDEGCEMLRTALEIDPQLDRAEEALRRAVSIAPQHLRLIDLYEHVGRQPGHERALVHALVLRAELPGAEVPTLREAVEVAVRIGDAALAESLLEKFVEGEQNGGQNVGNIAWALGALAGLREAAGDLRRAVELKKAAARIADPEVARKLEFEVAHLAADKLEDMPLAAETYESLHRADPADREAWQPLAAVYRKLGDAQRLADLLGKVADYVDDAAERSRLRLERVRVMMQSLGLDDADAAKLLREIVDEDRAQVEAALILADILDRRGKHDELAELLAAQIESAKDRTDGASIASLALRLGALLEKTDRVAARNVYYTGLDWDAKNRELLDALLRLLEGEGDEGERADVMERRLAVAQGPEAEEMALALWAARMASNDEPAAERALEMGYRAHPASAGLRERLETAYRERAEWAKVAELCVLDASARADTGERVARLREAAALWRGELSDLRAAAAALRLAREAAPDDESLMREHLDLLMEAGDHAAAAAELTAALETLAPDDASRAAWLGARAQVRAAGGDDAGAMADLEAAFETDHDSHAAALAGQLARARDAAAAAGDVTTAHELRLREAQVLPYAGDVDGARAILAELVRHDPKDRIALRTLAALEAALERWDAASAALRRLVGLEEGEAMVETAMRLADACERGGRPGDARGALERARAAAPQDTAVRERLERVYDQTGAWHELAELYLGDARASGDVAVRFAGLLRAGTLLLKLAGDPEAALAALEEARALRPSDTECVCQLADAYTLSGRTQDALTLLDQVLAPLKGRRSREVAPLYWRLARVARAMGDTATEGRWLVAALEADSQNGDVCSDVALRAIELDQLELASRALRAVTLLKTPGPMSKALAYQYMGEIARRQGDPKRALMHLKRAITEDPSLEGAKALIDAIERGY
jgi:tetratricopeptide (TPR) repeat protein